MGNINSNQEIIENSKILINVGDCTKCKACVNDCVPRLFYFKDDRLQIANNFEEDCIECGHCVAICPVNVIQLKTRPLDGVKDLPAKEKGITYDSLYNLVQTRRSIRQFKEKPVPKETIEKILELSRHSPTGSNTENVHYTVVKNPELLTKFSEALTKNVSEFIKKYEDPEGFISLKALLGEKMLRIVGERLDSFKRILLGIKVGIEFWHWNTEIIIIHAPKETTSTLVEDCSLAACHIMLAAETLGLATCSLGYATSLLNQFSSVSELVKIPKGHVVGYTLSIGYSNIKYHRIPARKPVRVKWL